MINQVYSVKTGSNAYSDFAVSNSQNFPVQTNTKDKTDKFIPEDLIKEEEENGKHSHKRAKYIVMAAGGVTLLILGFVSGLHKNIFKYIKNLRSKLEIKSHKTGNVSRLTHIMNKIIDKAESINNFHSLKVVGIKKGMFAFSNQTPKNKFQKFLNRTYNRITNFFTKISWNTVSKSYKKSSSKLNKIHNFILKINSKSDKKWLNELVTIDGLTKSRKEWFNEYGFKGVVDKHNVDFSSGGLDERLHSMLNSMSDFDVKFWNASYNLKNLKTNIKGLSKDFVAQKILAQDKAQRISNLSAKRAVITNDIADACSSMQLPIRDIDSMLNTHDIQSIKQISVIKSHLNTFIKRHKGNGILDSKSISKVLEDDFEQLLSAIKAKPEMYSEKQIQNIESKLKTAQNILNNSKDGEVQKLLYIYKQLLPEKEFDKLNKLVKKYNTSLHKSIDKEFEFFDKLRDFSIGTAPFDVADIFLGLLPLSYFMIRAKDKDKRISIALKYGIPTIATFGTSLYCTTGLLSGGKALGFGLIAGLVTNRICKLIDTHRKHYNTN